MEDFKMGKLLHLEKWQAIQDNLSKMTNMAIITVDYKGIPVTAHSSCSRFCDAVRKDPKLGALCQKCDSRAGLEAVRSNGPYIYLCHFGIVDVAVPITVDGNYIGAVMAGQVRLSEQDGEHELERIIARTSSLEGYADAYDALPVLGYDAICQIADTLYQLLGYVVEEALEKRFLLSMLEGGQQTGEAAHYSGDFMAFKMRGLKRLKEDMDSVLANATISRRGAEVVSDAHPLLKPALEYIYSHKEKNPGQKEMAELCKISPSYFSRLFAAGFGDSYSSYLSKLKMKWATELLLETELSVAQVGEALGFADDGYFIKKFKKFEGVTPLVYRKYYRKV